MKKSSLLLLALAAFLPPTFANDLASERELFKTFIETRRILGEEQAEWTTRKASIDDMISVLTTEAGDLRARIENLQASESSGADTRATLNARHETARALSTGFNDTLATLEARAATLGPRLPAPLRQEIQPLLARLPVDPARTRLGYSQRLQTLVGILAQTNKFNSSLKYVSEIKTLDAGSFEVETLYFGLGAAFFSDASGAYAGHGRPGPEGWTWTTVEPAAGVRIRQAIDTYLSRRAPTFVTVPASID